MKSLTFRLLEVFQQVVDTGSVTAASSALALSQPTVSLQLKKLATLVGMPLLEQSQGGVQMTEAGHAVYLCAQEVLSSHSKLNHQIQALHGLEVGSLKLAVVTTAKYVIPPLLSAFNQLHPNIDVRFTVANREQIVARLNENKDDLYIFSHPPNDTSLACMPFLDNHLQVIAPESYVGPNNCHLRELSAQKFLLREPGSGTRRTLDQYCRGQNIVLSPNMTIESNEALRLAVESGLGLSVLSEHTLGQTPSSRVKILNIIDFPLQTRWQAVTVKNRPTGLATTAFLDLLKQSSTVS